jgi:nucleoside-diphosphate-sugar epimerase
VYGVKEVSNVTEDLSLEPLTDYSKFKAMCEEVLQQEKAPGFTTVTIRPATVCGYSPRLRLDLAVNILTNLAQNKREITVLGGSQMRPNIHIEDMTDLYILLLRLPSEKIDGKIFNAGYENHTVADIATKVRSIVGDDVKVVTKPTDDNRSYHISSEKIQREIGFTAKHSVGEAIQDLVAAFKAGKVPNPLSDIRYFNIKTMQSIKLK